MDGSNKVGLVDIPGVSGVKASELDLYTVDTVHAIDKQDKNEDESYL